jgi:hypothetical protein
MTGGWKGAESQKQVFRSFPPALEIASAIPTFPLPRQRLLLTKGEPKKQGPITSRSGSFFNEKMLKFSPGRTRKLAEFVQRAP